MSSIDIPFVDLKSQYRRLKGKIDGRIHQVLEHGQYIDGPEVAEFERLLATYVGAKHCIGVSSGTDALLIAMMACGIARGDAVFLPAFTFPATTEVVLRLGATPVLVDVERSTFNICVFDLERKIVATEKAGSLSPRMVVAVDLFGMPADYSSLSTVARSHEITILADAAQSLSGVLNGRKVGTLAPVTATSFYPSKPLGCYGDGGAVLCGR